MKFSEFLNKDLALDRVKSNCGIFLQHTDKPLYRGISQSLTRDLFNTITLNTFFKTKSEIVRKDRLPRDSSVQAHKLIDEWFNNNFQIKPRSEGVFCSGDKEIASKYGKLVYVFPVQHFRYVWGVYKETEQPVKDTVKVSKHIDNLLYINKREKAKEIADKVMNKIEWKMHNLEIAQELGTEIAILCDEVILVPVIKYPIYKHLYQKLTS